MHILRCFNVFYVFDKLQIIIIAPWYAYMRYTFVYISFNLCRFTCEAKWMDTYFELHCTWVLTSSKSRYTTLLCDGITTKHFNTNCKLFSCKLFGYACVSLIAGWLCRESHASLIQYNSLYVMCEWETLTVVGCYTVQFSKMLPVLLLFICEWIR